MKKILLTLACVFGMSMAALAVQNSAVMLQHDGNITTYEPEQINDAIEAAKDGDVIYLTAGDFPGFTINKQISIKGSGMQTVIKGTVKVENPERTLNNVFVGYMYMYGQSLNDAFHVNSRVKGLKIIQCRLCNITYNAITEDSYIDRCEILNYQRGLDIDATYKETVTIDGVSSTYTRSYMQGLTITNSVISHIEGCHDVYQDVSFINCYFKSGATANLCGVKIVNSILDKNFSIFLYKSELTNSSYNGVDLDSDCKLADCYDVKIEDYTSEDLVTNGYLGNDGTVIGPMGGNTPYTLEPALPHVTKADMKVDPDKQQLNVTLTVSPK